MRPPEPMQERDRRDLTALADGSLSVCRRMAVERRVPAASPALRTGLQRQLFVVGAMDAIETQRPLGDVRGRACSRSRSGARDRVQFRLEVPSGRRRLLALGLVQPLQEGSGRRVDALVSVVPADSIPPGSRAAPRRSPFETEVDPTPPATRSPTSRSMLTSLSALESSSSAGRAQAEGGIQAAHC